VAGLPGFSRLSALGWDGTSCENASAAGFAADACGENTTLELVDVLKKRETSRKGAKAQRIKEGKITNRRQPRKRSIFSNSVLSVTSYSKFVLDFPLSWCLIAFA
jgi:hypothetical protein